MWVDEHMEMTLFVQVANLTCGNKSFDCLVAPFIQTKLQEPQDDAIKNRQH